MTKFFLIIASIITHTIIAQNAYTEDMSKTLTHKNLDTLTSNLEKLSIKYPEQWLPNYYLAYHTINNSFLHLKDEEFLNKELEKAQSYIYKLQNIKHDKAEVLVLQAKLYLVYIASNSEKYGRTYAPLITKLNNDALVLAPSNPRVILNKAQWEIGSANYFGYSSSKFCINLEQAVTQFKHYKLKETFAPNWGKQEAIDALNACK